jgi:hypothetical protein
MKQSMCHGVLWRNSHFPFVNACRVKVAVVDARPPAIILQQMGDSAGPEEANICAGG